MLWKTDKRATETARQVFPAHAPRVLCNGKHQYVLQPTPFGRVELVGFEQGFVVAAEHPPAGRLIDPDRLPQRLLGHLHAHGLRPWKVVHSDDCAEAIRALLLAEPDAPAGAAIPFVAPLVPARELVGENRRSRAEQLAGLAGSQRFPGPLGQLVGPDGAGKRTLAAAAARDMGWSLVGELPLSRLLIDRVLQTPLETALDAVLTAAAAMGQNHLLAVSDAELLDHLEDRARRAMLRELARLPHVVLLNRARAAGSGDLVTLQCPGLESPADVRALLAQEHPEVAFAGAALDLAARAASVPGVGVVPGRLLYLVRLAKALRPAGLPEATGTARQVDLAPDEVTGAVALAAQAWDEDPWGETW